MPERVTLAPPKWRLDEGILLNGRAVMQKGVLLCYMYVPMVSKKSIQPGAAAAEPAGPNPRMPSLPVTRPARPGQWGLGPPVPLGSPAVSRPTLVT